MFNLENILVLQIAWYWCLLWASPLLISIYLLFWSNTFSWVWSNPLSVPSSFFFNHENSSDKKKKENQKYLSTLSSPLICDTLIIGAPYSALPVLRSLERQGVPFLCVEESLSPANDASLHLPFLSKNASEFKDLPFSPPSSLSPLSPPPSLLSPSLLSQYTHSYLSPLSHRILFGHKLISLTQTPSHWQAEVIRLSDNTPLSFSVRNVISPSSLPLPSWKALSSSGDLLSFPLPKSPKKPSPLSNKRVLVLEQGQQGLQLCLSLLDKGALCTWSNSSPIALVPKVLFGRIPLDFSRPWLPSRLSTLFLQCLSYLTFGTFPSPFSSFIFTPSTLQEKILEGKFLLTNGVLRIAKHNTVLFDSGHSEKYDYVIGTERDLSSSFSPLSSSGASFSLHSPKWHDYFPSSVRHLLHDSTLLTMGMIPDGLRNFYVCGSSESVIAPGAFFTLQGEVIAALIKREPLVRVPCGEVLDCLRLPKMRLGDWGCVDRRKSSVGRSFTIWKELVIVLRVFIVLLPFLEIFFRRWRFLKEGKKIKEEETVSTRDGEENSELSSVAPLDSPVVDYNQLLA